MFKKAIDKFFEFVGRNEKLVGTILFVLFGLGLIALLLYAVQARADDQVQWEFPTQRTDGAALLLSEIATTRVRYRDLATGVIETIPVPSPTNSIFVTRDPSAPGTRCYMARIVDTAGKESDWSAEVCKAIDGVIVLMPPRPPGALRVT